jgi:hypothetical protein
MNVETNASQSKTFNLGVSSSFSRANNALKFVTPGHFDGGVLTITGSSVEYFLRLVCAAAFAIK